MAEASSLGEFLVIRFVFPVVFTTGFICWVVGQLLWMALVAISYFLWDASVQAVVYDLPHWIRRQLLGLGSFAARRPGLIVAMALALDTLVLFNIEYVSDLATSAVSPLFSIMYWWQRRLEERMARIAELEKELRLLDAQWSALTLHVLVHCVLPECATLAMAVPASLAMFVCHASHRESVVTASAMARLHEGVVQKDIRVMPAERRLTRRQRARVKAHMDAAFLRRLLCVSVLIMLSVSWAIRNCMASYQIRGNELWSTYNLIALRRAHILEEVDELRRCWI